MEYAVEQYSNKTLRTHRPIISESITRDENLKKIVTYYEGAGPDYHEWSKEYNMHFGYGGLRTLFQRERMLDAMNAEVINRLYIDYHTPSSILDLGCGLGTTVRAAARRYPKAQCTGITIVPWQVERGMELNAQSQLPNVVVLEGDYTRTPFADNSFDAIYAVESICHALGEAKEEVIAEARRVLKPGGRFVVTDGFLKLPSSSLSPLMTACYTGICENWTLPSLAEIGVFARRFAEMGFDNIEIEDISWKVAPSVAHVPLVISKFLLKRIIGGKPIKRQSLNNLIGCFLTMILGLKRSAFGYYIVSAVKR